jgi:hypothetical protein
MVTLDGMPLVWLLKWGGLRHVDRVYDPDLMLAVFGADQLRNARHFFCGTTEPTFAALSSRLRERFPTARIVGAVAPPLRLLLTAEEEVHIAELLRHGSGCRHAVGCFFFTEIARVPVTRGGNPVVMRAFQRIEADCAMPRSDRPWTRPIIGRHPSGSRFLTKL